MPLDYAYAKEMMAAKPEPLQFSYSDREVMLYALGIGMGRDPLDANELPFVYEKDLKVVPTFAAVAPSNMPPRPGPNVMMGLKVNFAMFLHGEQRMTFHKPLPPAGTFTTESVLLGVYDKGPKGAIIVQQSVIRDLDGAPIVTAGGSGL